MPMGDVPGFDRHPRSGVFPGRLLYPVLSRRSGGLSLGVNLFPDGKKCNFDCAYCEVPPASIGGGQWSQAPFDLGELERELCDYATFHERRPAGLAVRDLAISGDGEPTLSPALGDAISLLARARQLWPATYGGAELVLITNSSGFLDPGLSAMLGRAVEELDLRIWAKLDAGTEADFLDLDRPAVPFARIIAGLAAFSEKYSLTIQMMSCALSGLPGGLPAAQADAGILARAELLALLLGRGARISALQLYTQARPAFYGLTASLSDGALVREAGLIRRTLAAAGFGGIPLRVFGSIGEIDIDGGPA